MVLKKSALLYLLAYFLVFILNSVQRFFPDKELYFMVQLVLYSIFSFWGLYLFRKPLKQEWQKLLQKKGQSIGQIVGVYLADQVFMTVFALLSMGLLSAFQITSSLQNDTNIEKGMALVSPYITLPVLGIFGPIVEELIFRKILQETFSKHLSTWLTITLQALLFALIHVHKLEVGEFVQVLPHFGSGLLFGLIKGKTGNTWCVIVPHVLNNVFGLLHYL